MTQPATHSATKHTAAPKSTIAPEQPVAKPAAVKQSAAAKPPATPAPAAKSPAPHGRRNLLILGAAAICIALVTTGLELIIYHASGDIYLDRSRPGFLPDPDEENSDDTTAATSDYSFSDNSVIDRANLERYLVELQKLRAKIDQVASPYSEQPLSDASLGIAAPEEEQ